MAFQDLLNPILGPPLRLPPLLSVILVAFLISMFIVLIYRKLTDQTLMKNLKAEIKELQAEMKQLKDKPKEMMKVQKKAMETNTKYMMQSFKPTLITFIPIILIFGWLNAHMAYYPIVQDSDFGVTIQFKDGVSGTVEIIAPDGVTVLDSLEQEIRNNKVEWAMTAKADTYTLEYVMDDTMFNNRLIITEDSSIRDYAKPELRESELGLKDSGIEKLIVSNERIKPLKSIPLVGSIPWIGNFGWLGTYILFSIIFSITMRKVLKVY